jgi:hypothetical protein
MNETLRELLAVSKAQLEAVRRSDLDRLEALGLQRRTLMEGLDREALARLAGEPAERTGEILRAILENDRLVGSALREGMRRRREDLAEVDTRRRAEAAYRRGR